MTAEPLDISQVSAFLTGNPAERSKLIALLSQLPPEQRATCPKCRSTSIQVVNVEKKNLGAAMLAEWLLDSTAAGVAAGSKMILTNTCISCGFQWVPGSIPEAVTRLQSGQLGDDTFRKQLLDQMRRREQEQQVQRQHARRNGWIFAGIVAALSIGVWAYATQLSPEARARAEELQETDQWVRCVLAQHPRDASTCGPMTRVRLNTWFEHGHMDMLANTEVRATLEKLAPIR